MTLPITARSAVDRSARATRPPYVHAPAAFPPFTPLRAARRLGRKLRVNVTSETTRFRLTEQGGHTAFLDCVDLMEQHPDLEIRVNFRDLPAYKLLYPSEHLVASDVAGFGALLREILESPPHRELLSRASRRLASHFPPAQFIESLARLYDQLACEALRAS